jgi:hypothetical protein
MNETWKVHCHSPSSIKGQCHREWSNSALEIFKTMPPNVMRRSDLGDVTGFTLRLCALIVGAGAAEMSW